jgi:hypothetical protein
MTDDFTTAHSNYIDGTYDCVDRIVVNAYFVLGKTPGGFRNWWRLLYGSDDNLDDTRLMRLAGRVSRRVHAWAAASGIPIQDCTIGERKHEMAEELIPQDPKFKGVFLIQVCKAPAPIWHVKRKKDWLSLSIKQPWSYVNHYCFQIMDPEWGHITIRMSGHPPFGAMIILNGHEWVEREAKRRHTKFTKIGNSFNDCSNFPLLDRIAGTLNSESSIGRLAEVCDRWIYSSCLLFALNLEEQERTGFQYSYSAYQIEYSRNISFKRGSDLDAIYQRLVDLSRNSFQIEKIKTIFGTKRRSSRRKYKTKSRIAMGAQITVEKHEHNLTVFRVQFGHIAIRIYDKGDRLLRVEAVAHDTRQLKCGKVIANLPKIIAALRDMVIRFLNALSWAHTAFMDQGALDELPQPSQLGNRRVAGIDINRSRTRHTVEAVIALSTRHNGFSISDLAKQVRQITGWDDATYGLRQATYDLLKLRAKDIVTKVDKSRRYIVQKTKLQTIATMVIVREKVVKPLFSASQKTDDEIMQIQPCNQLDQHYLNLQRELRAAFATMRMVPS